MHSSRRKCLASILVGISVLGHVGCQRSSDSPTGNANVVSTGAPKSPTRGGQIAENTLKGKADLYIGKCVNKYSPDVENSFDSYKYSFKDLDAGPTGRESSVRAFSEIEDGGQECLDAINRAKALSPSLPDVEASAERYGAALKEVATRINGIASYYERGDFKDDKFARGKEAHSALVKAFRDFEAANEKFGEDISRLEDQIAQGDLKELEGKPDQRFQYLVTDTGIKAKKVSTAANKPAFDQIDANALQSLIDDFGKSVDQLKAAEPEAKGQMPPTLMASGYITGCEDFLVSSKELMRRVRDNKPFTDSDLRMGGAVKGTPENIVNEYNSMISARNILR